MFKLKEILINYRSSHSITGNWIALVFLVAFLFTNLNGYSQNSNLRNKTLFLISDSTSIDSLSIAPGTFKCQINELEVSPDKYILDWPSAMFVWKGELPSDSIKFSYRVYQINFSEDIFLRDTTLILPNDNSNFDPFIYRPESFQVDKFETMLLDKSGSITRGLLFGNNQDLSVNSSLDLQLNGKITDRISVLASISDANIPIQPEGNTQQLQDFDNIFIQLYDDNTRLTAGDFNLRRSQGYFLKYFKKAKGLNITHNIEPSYEGDNSVSVETSFAISKGKFSRNNIQGVEGNQGPYRLRGEENETFIIVLSGSERVYIDGKLLKRGLDQDYVINYNSSEIIFTAKQPITKDKRIVVEFQYSDKNYARSLAQGLVVNKSEKVDWFVNIYAEQDAKNQPLQLDLENEDKRVLSEAGDDLLQAIVSGVDSVAYSNELVMYKLVDSLGFSPVYVFSTDQDSAKYQIIYSFVGEGNADYIESDFSANGKVYKWIKPEEVDGELLHFGNFAPVRLLAAPNKQQMASVGMNWRLNENVEVQMEGSISNKDLNTFSSINNSDNVGGAFKGSLNWKKPLKGNELNDENWKIGTKVYTELNNSSFTRVERFRSVEFIRDWNLTNDQEVDLSLYGGNFGLENSRKGFVNAGVERLELDELNGFKGLLDADLTFNKFKIKERASALETNGTLDSKFIRHKSDVSYAFNFIKIGFKDEFEENRRLITDSLQQASYGFYDYQFYLSNVEEQKNTYNIFYRRREDKGVFENSFTKSAIATQYGMSLGLVKNPLHRANLTVSNRKLEIVNEELINVEPENTLLIQLNHNLRNKKGWLNFQTYYEIGSGLEQQREFIYLEVPAGQGIYVWNDYNGDNIKDLNEFEIAAFEYEANYIRTFLPSNDYARVYTNVFNENIQLILSQLVLKNEKLDKALSHFSTNTSFRIERRTDFDEDLDRFNPFVANIADTNLLSLTGFFRNTVFYRLPKKQFSIEYSYQDNSTKSLLTNGFETRENLFHEAIVRIQLIDFLNLEITGRNGIKENSSDFLLDRDYKINYVDLIPSLTWSPDPKYALIGRSRFSVKDNAQNLGAENSNRVEIGIEARLNQPGKGSFSAQFNLIDIEYSGGQNNSLTFEMLEGLNPGTNYTWTANWQKKVSDNIQINFIYQGRSSEGNKAIHSGGMSARAFF